jgi:hypothetical protein
MRSSRTAILQDCEIAGSGISNIKIVKISARQDAAQKPPGEIANAISPMIGILQDCKISVQVLYALSLPFVWTTRRSAKGNPRNSYAFLDA